MAARLPDQLRDRLRAIDVFDDDLPEFEIGEAPDYPAELFASWLIEAIETGVRAPHAMTLSTVDPAGRPNARVLILKGIDADGWEFASSRRSPKGAELTASAWAAATFYWPELGRQIRIRGQVSEAGAERSAADFLARSAQARAETLIGKQSEVLEDQLQLQAALETARARISSNPELVADDWVLYVLSPREVEFFQAESQRRHLRLRYERQDEGWSKRQLWP